jgi:peroxiredoxin
MYKYLSLSIALVVLFIATAQTKPKPAAKPAAAKASASTKKSSNSEKKGKKGPDTKASFVINGKLEGYANYQIRLYKYQYNNSSFIDSVFTNDTGGFTFNKTLPENSIVYVQYSSTTAVPLIVENGSVFDMIIYTKLNGLNYDLTGVKSEKSLNIYNFLKRFSKLNGEMSSFETQIANEQDPMKSYTLQMYAGMKQQELQSTIDSMILHKSALEGYFVLFNFTEEQQPAQMKAIYSKMEPNETNSAYYKDLKKLYESTKGVEIGEMAPDIDLPQPNGTNLKLSSLRGKVVLIDFWASWCGPCRAEFPNVKKVYSKYKDQGFEIYGVSLDKDKSAWVNSISSLGLDWKHVSDLKYWSCAPAKVYKVSGIPATVLIDKTGKVIAKNLRGEELEKKLAELFQ